MSTPLADSGLSPQQQIELLERRLRRSEQARQAAEALLEARARELDRSNRELREREERLLERLEFGNRQLLAAQRTAHIATAYRARSDRTVFSPELRELLGLAPAQPLDADSLLHAIHPLDRERVAREETKFYTVFPAGTDHVYEHRIIRYSDQALRWFRWTLRREIDGEGHLLSVFGTVQDITERREASRRAAALRVLADRRVRALSRMTDELKLATHQEQQALAFLRAVIDTVPQGIAVFDEDFRLAVWNSPMAALTEIDPDALSVGLPFNAYTALHWQHDPGASTDRLQRDRRGRVVKQAFVQSLSDGRTVQVDVIPRPGGGMVKIYTDVSQFKAIEGDLRSKSRELADRVDELTRLSSELQRSNFEAEQASRSKSQFLAMMSHDIRTPMNGLLGMLDTLSRTALDAGQRRQLELARASGQQLNLLLDDVIEIVRAESGKIDLQREPQDIRRIVTGSHAFWQEANRNPAIRLHCHVDDALPGFALLDPTRFRQLLDNLVSNALKYTPQGEVRIAALKAGSYLRLEVIDSGPGIARDEQSRLFDDFSRLTMNVGDGSKSAGLGLAICKRLVRAMDGRIGVDSEVGKGSCFWVELPLLACDPPASALLPDTALAPSTASLSEQRILVAEDGETNREVLAIMLEQTGCVFVMVEDGQAAVEAVRNGGFSLVLMDVNMPRLDGAEATRRIRQLPGPQADVPIIGVTAHVLRGEREALIEAGMDAVVAKPLSLRSLLDAIDRVEARRHGLDVEQSAESAVPLPVLDTAAVDLLLGSLPVARRQHVLSLSLHEIEALAKQLDSCARAGDAAGVARAAHSLKGVAANIGAQRLAEMMADARDLDLDAFAAVLAETLAALRHQI